MLPSLVPTIHRPQHSLRPLSGYHNPAPPCRSLCNPRQSQPLPGLCCRAPYAGGTAVAEQTDGMIVIKAVALVLSVAASAGSAKRNAVAVANIHGKISGRSRA